MPDSEPAPFIRLEVGGSAPVLRYDIPEPTSYEGKNFIELELGSVFSQAAQQLPSRVLTSQLSDLPRDAIKDELKTYLRTGTSLRAELPDFRVGASLASFIDEVTTRPEVLPPPDSSPPPRSPIDDLMDGLAEQLQDGYHLVKWTDLYGDNGVKPAPPVPDVPDPHLYLVETFRLTSYLGDYGAGRIVKTFSLLPGEVTKISVKTFRQTESTRRSASSVLDSFTKESASDLESSLLTEQSDQTSYAKTTEYYAEASGGASWGFGSASGKAGTKGSTNATRQEAVKNVSSATQKHSARASAKREVEINTSYEVSEKEGEELSIERQVENINLSRTLNFVFRQMNQEFITFLHLTDVRIGFFNGDGKSRREVSLSGLDGLLQEVVKPASQKQVRDIILEQLSAIRDHAGNLVDVVKTVSISQGDEFRQFDTSLATSYTDRNNRQYEIPGVLLKIDYLVMRTEGVIVEALLGNGTALDAYAERLQGLEVARQEAETRRQKALAERDVLVNKVVSNGDGQRADLLEQLTCPCHHPSDPALRIQVDSRPEPPKPESPDG